VTETSWKQRAYDKLLNDGWTKGRASDPETGECCAGGAIAWAITGDPTDMYSDNYGNRYDEVRSALEEFAVSIGGDPDDDENSADVLVLAWNDSSRRTEEEVLEAFRQLADAEVASTT